jgi:hypothetical protein
MIRKLRNQPYAPKSGASSQMRAKRKKKTQHFWKAPEFFKVDLLVVQRSW